MGRRDIPAPMPAHIRDQVNFELAARDLEVLDDNGRFIVRRMVAEAYAVGFQEGRIDQMQNDQIDRQMAIAKTPTAEEGNRG